MHGATERREEMEPIGAHGRVLVVDQHLFEEGIDGRAELRELGDGAAIVVGAHLGGGSRVDGLDGVDKIVLGVEREDLARWRRAGIGLAVFFLFGGENVGGALVAGEEVLAVGGIQERRERFDAAGDLQEYQAESLGDNGVDQIVTSCRSSRSRTFSRS